MSTIIRVEKKERYTVVPNNVINDSSLSWEARGLLIYLLSKPNDWVVRLSDLIKQGPAGRDKTRRIIKELEQAGYIHRRKKRGKDGKFYWESVVCEQPVNTIYGKSVDGFSVDGSPVDGEAVDLLSTDPLSTDSLNTDLPNTDKKEARETSDDVSRGGKPPARQSSDDSHSVQEKPKRRKRERDERLKHPAIQTWADVTGTKSWRLNKYQRGLIVDRVRGDPETLARWRVALEHWLGHGWNPVNVAGQIEFFENGGPDRCKACQKQQHHRGGRNGRTPWLPASEDPAWIDDEENLRRARELGYIDEHGNVLIELG